MEAEVKLKEPWQILCEQAAEEQDPDRLMALIKQISHLLDERLKQREEQSAA